MSLITQHLHLCDKDTTERLCRVETMLGSIIEKLETLQMSFEEDMARAKAAQAVTDAALETANTKLDGIKGDVDNLKALLAAVPVTGMTPEQQAAVKDLADGLEALAAKAGNLSVKAGAIDDQTQ